MQRAAAACIACTAGCRYLETSRRSSRRFLQPLRGSVSARPLNRSGLLFFLIILIYVSPFWFSLHDISNHRFIFVRICSCRIIVIRSVFLNRMFGLSCSNMLFFRIRRAFLFLRFFVLENGSPAFSGDPFGRAGTVHSNSTIDNNNNRKRNLSRSGDLGTEFGEHAAVADRPGNTRSSWALAPRRAFPGRFLFSAAWPTAFGETARDEGERERERARGGISHRRFGRVPPVGRPGGLAETASLALRSRTPAAPPLAAYILLLEPPSGARYFAQ